MMRSNSDDKLNAFQGTPPSVSGAKSNSRSDSKEQDVLTLKLIEEYLTMSFLFKRGEGSNVKAEAGAPLTPSVNAEVPTVEAHLHPFFHTEIYRYVQEISKPYRNMCLAAYTKARTKVCLLIGFVFLLIVGDEAMIVTAIQKRSHLRRAEKIEAASTQAIEKVRQDYAGLIADAETQRSSYVAQAAMMSQANKAAFEKAIAEGRKTSGVKPYIVQLDSANAKAERSALRKAELQRERDGRINEIIAKAEFDAKLDVETAGLYLLGMILPWSVFLCSLRAAGLKREGRDGAFSFVGAGWIGQIVAAYFTYEFGALMFIELDFNFQVFKLNAVGIALATVVIFLYTRAYEAVSGMILDAVDNREKEIFRARRSMREEIGYRRQIVYDVVEYERIIDQEHRRILENKYNFRREVDKKETEVKTEQVRNEIHVEQIRKDLQIEMLIPKAATPSELGKRLVEMEAEGTLDQLKTFGLTLKDIARRNNLGDSENYNRVTAAMSSTRKLMNGKNGNGKPETALQEAEPNVQ